MKVRDASVMEIPRWKVTGQGMYNLVGAQWTKKSVEYQTFKSIRKGEDIGPPGIKTEKIL